ncbi:DUF190 domain-containing protein [Neomoorella mulderi]|uniref:DUF190 domain-containing protein n=1 Tax=Neomoorella mulderi TaxID=202604 RepID=UPI001F3C528A|nr:DUF190 domain-containing protein [Moorella mulderi]
MYAARMLDLSYDLPVIVEAVDRAEKVASVLPQVQAIVSQGLITVSDVEIILHEDNL